MKAIAEMSIFGLEVNLARFFKPPLKKCSGVLVEHISPAILKVEFPRPNIDPQSEMPVEIIGSNVTLVRTSKYRMKALFAFFYIKMTKLRV